MKYLQLVKAIDSASQQLLGRAATVVNQALVLRNWLIGAYIVEFEQQGKDRAKYGQRLHSTLAKDLGRLGWKGCGERMLQQMAHFYRVYPQLRSGIPQALIAELAILPTASYSAPLITQRQELSGRKRKPRSALLKGIPQTVFAESAGHDDDSISCARGIGPLRKMPSAASAPLSELVASSQMILRFSWSKILELIRLDDPLKRAFYENECLLGNWSVRQLQRSEQRVDFAERIRTLSWTNILEHWPGLAALPIWQGLRSLQGKG